MALTARRVTPPESSKWPWRTRKATSDTLVSRVVHHRNWDFIVTKFYLKQILWNPEGYSMPFGFKANTGYPSETGYGHEEWNNAPHMAYGAKNERFRVFHTEGLGNAPVSEHVGRIFLFMYASHDGIQQLVGIAGNSTSLTQKQHAPERRRLMRRLKINKHWRDAWNVQRVKDCYGGDRARFREDWTNDVHWIPNWKCLEDYFFWPDPPVTLDAMRITGKTKLLSMYGSYTEIGHDSALALMESVPSDVRTLRWERILEAIDAPLDQMYLDLEQIMGDQSKDGKTMRQTLIDTRLGQGRFRQQLIERWGGTCAVSKCKLAQVLRASHIKPWRVSTNTERLDPNNGLLLSANIDALFDKGLVSFNDKGEMLVSKQIPQIEKSRLKLSAGLSRNPNREERHYLKYHRCQIFNR